MPWTAVEKEYGFEGPDGPASLLDLFEGRRQLIVYRFFVEPGVAESHGTNAVLREAIGSSAPRRLAVARLAEWAEEGSDVVGEEVGGFHGGEVTTAVEFRPVDDGVFALGEAPDGDVAREDGDPGGDWGAF
jgi:hypothetical protein